MTQPTIEIENVGAVEEFAYTLQAPGLHVLKGRNGAGKTTIIRAIQMALGEDVDIKPSKRDGASRGIASVAGKTIKIMKTTREEGELSVSGLGELNIYDLHSPAFKNANTRDRHRISTLVRLTGQKASPQLFHGLVESQQAFDAVVTADALQTDDLVEMAARVKRAFEKEALRLEGLNETAMANVLAQTRIAEQVSHELPHDAEQLQNELEVAIKQGAQVAAEFEAVSRRQAEAKEAAKRADEARARLERIGPGADRAAAIETLQKSQEESAAVIRSAEERMLARQSDVQRLQDELDEIRQKLAIAEEQYDNASNVLESVKREGKAREDACIEAVQAAEYQTNIRAELVAAIEAGSVAGPTDEQIAAIGQAVDLAHENVEDAKKAITLGVQVREAIKAKARADEYQAEANGYAIRARRLRGAAADTGTVLTKAIAQLNDCPLKVKMTEDGDPRLVIATERSATEYFDERSDGQRWETVLQIAAGANKLIVLQQAAYGEMSPSMRQRIHDLARQHGCYVLTALADDGELRGEMFEP